MSYNFEDSHLMPNLRSKDPVSPYRFYVPCIIGLRINGVKLETNKETLQSNLAEQNLDTCLKYCPTLGPPSQRKDVITGHKT
jgi:hypothetical protein